MKWGMLSILWHYALILGNKYGNSSSYNTSASKYQQQDFKSTHGQADHVRLNQALHNFFPVNFQLLVIFHLYSNDIMTFLIIIIKKILVWPYNSIERQSLWVMFTKHFLFDPLFQLSQQSSSVWRLSTWQHRFNVTMTMCQPSLAGIWPWLFPTSRCLVTRQHGWRLFRPNATATGSYLTAWSLSLRSYLRSVNFFGYTKMISNNLLSDLWRDTHKLSWRVSVQKEQNSNLHHHHFPQLHKYVLLIIKS